MISDYDLDIDSTYSMFAIVIDLIFRCDELRNENAQSVASCFVEISDCPGKNLQSWNFPAIFIDEIFMKSLSKQ